MDRFIWAWGRSIPTDYHGRQLLVVPNRHTGKCQTCFAKRMENGTHEEVQHKGSRSRHRRQCCHSPRPGAPPAPHKPAEVTRIANALARQRYGGTLYGRLSVRLLLSASLECRRRQKVGDRDVRSQPLDMLFKYRTESDRIVASTVLLIATVCRHRQGGGWCYNEGACYGRTLPSYAGGVLGSSKNWTSTFGTYYLDDQDWNRVFLRYCSGESYPCQ